MKKWNWKKTTICQLKWYDFVVFTKAELNVERIEFDKIYWLSELFPKHLDFYLSFGIPFLKS